MLYKFHCDLRLSSYEDCASSVFDHLSVNLPCGIDRAVYQMMGELKGLFEELKDRGHFRPTHGDMVRLSALLTVENVLKQTLEVDVGDYFSMVTRNGIDCESLSELFFPVLYGIRQQAREQISLVPIRERRVA